MKKERNYRNAQKYYRFFLKKTGFGMGGGEVYLPLQQINSKKKR